MPSTRDDIRGAIRREPAARRFGDHHKSDGTAAGECRNEQDFHRRSRQKDRVDVRTCDANRHELLGEQTARNRRIASPQSWRTARHEKPTNRHLSVCRSDTGIWGRADRAQSHDRAKRGNKRHLICGKYPRGYLGSGAALTDWLRLTATQAVDVSPMSSFQHDLAVGRIEGARTEILGALARTVIALP